MPREKGKRSDIEPCVSTTQGWSKNTIAAYRKLADNVEKLDAYYESIDDVEARRKLRLHLPAEGATFPHG